MQSVLAGSPVAEEKRRLRKELRTLRQALDASALSARDARRACRRGGVRRVARCAHGRRLRRLRRRGRRRAAARRRTPARRRHPAAATQPPAARAGGRRPRRGARGERCCRHPRAAIRTRNEVRNKKKKKNVLLLGPLFLCECRARSAMLWRSSTAKLTYGAWYGKISALVAGFDDLGLRPGRPSGHAAAELLGSSNDPLGLPVRRDHHHPAQLALQRERLIPPGRRRGEGDRVRGDFRRGGGFLEQTGLLDIAGVTLRSSHLRFEFSHGGECTRGRAWCRPRGVVGGAPDVRHDRTPEGACRAVSAPSAPQRLRISRRISTAGTNARSGPCRSITPWACAPCLPCR